MHALDKFALRRAYDRAAPDYDRHAVVYQQVCERLVARLDYIRCEPSTALDLGAGTGQAARLLQERYRSCDVIAADLSAEMLRSGPRARAWRRKPGRVQCDATSLPLPDASVDLLVSASTFHLCHDHARLFKEIKRVLRPRGVLLFATFGPDTLRELRDAWSQVDAGVRVHEFADMHDLGDAMLRAGLIDPVVDSEHLRLIYPQPRAVMQDLKSTGATNVSPDRPRGLLGRGALERLLSVYPGEADGSYVATYEVVYGHAWGSQTGERMVNVNFDSGSPERGQGPF